MFEIAGKTKVVIFFSKMDSYEKLLILSEILREDYGVNAFVVNIEDVWEGGIKRFNEEVSPYEEEETILFCVNLNNRHICEGTDCFLKDYTTLPVEPLQLDKRAANSVGMTAIFVSNLFNDPVFRSRAEKRTESLTTK